MFVGGFLGIVPSHLPHLRLLVLRMCENVLVGHIQGDRREPDVFEMVSMKPLAEVGRGCRY